MYHKHHMLIIILRVLSNCSEIPLLSQLTNIGIIIWHYYNISYAAYDYVISYTVYNMQHIAIYHIANVEDFSSIAWFQYGSIESCSWVFLCKVFLVNCQSSILEYRQFVQQTRLVVRPFSVPHYILLLKSGTQRDFSAAQNFARVFLLMLLL